MNLQQDHSSILDVHIVYNLHVCIDKSLELSLLLGGERDDNSKLCFSLQND